jgi:hypothetical protein
VQGSTPRQHQQCTVAVAALLPLSGRAAAAAAAAAAACHVILAPHKAAGASCGNARSSLRSTVTPLLLQVLANVHAFYQQQASSAEVLEAMCCSEAALQSLSEAFLQGSALPRWQLLCGYTELHAVKRAASLHAALYLLQLG